MSANSPEKQYAKHVDTISRRLKYLADKQPSNSYDKAEQSALDWVLYYITGSRENVASAIDSVETYEIVKKLKG